VLLGALAGCGPGSVISPEGEIRPAEELRFLRPAVDAPPLANPTLSFYAKRGVGREAFMLLPAEAGARRRRRHRASAA